MKNVITSFILTLTAIQAFANVNYIDISKISGDSKLVSAFNFVKDNTKYYDHWTNESTYDKSKKDLIKELREHFENFSTLTTKKEETHLLLGDIAHYLYNMGDTAYYNLAVSNYDAAIKGNPSDYRCYWFLGFHYALSSVSTSAIDNFRKAEKLLPSQPPADFWNDYAWATAFANMPSNCIYAMDQVKNILGKEGSFQQKLGETIYKRIVPIDKNQSYDKKVVWTVSQDDKTTFTSRPLGIRITMDSAWELQVHDYQKRQAALIMTPQAIANKKGKEIQYSVAILMKAANDNDKLSDYISNFVSKYSDKKQISFSDKYDKMIAYEIKDKSMYQNMGGGHLYAVGIERNAPKYPGQLLENPATIPKGNAGKVTYYRASDSQDRFEGKIFYAILLDSCEDIHDQSFSIFKSLFDNQMIIE